MSDTGNNSRVGGPCYEADTVEEMRAFDRLPLTVRQAMRDAAMSASVLYPDFRRFLREFGARRAAEEIRKAWPCGGIQGERIPLAPEDAEWLARATRTNHPPRRKEASDE